MRFNDKQMIIVSHEKADYEDRLNYKKVSIPLGNSQNKGFKELWFKLKYNLLFYFKFNEYGQIDLTQPSGLIVLENSVVNCEEDCEAAFAFSITFCGEQKKHFFSARSEDSVKNWVSVLRKATYESLKKELKLLEEAISAKKKSMENRLEDNPNYREPVAFQSNGVTKNVTNLIEF